jgi:hypothetical protein
MATFNKFNSFVEDLAEKVHNLGSDTLKILLTNTAPQAADTHYDSTAGPPGTLGPASSAAEIAAQNGYSAGGGTVTVTASSQTSGTYKLVGSDLVFTASGGTFGPARYAVLYNATAGSAGARPLIGWWDRGASVTPAAGETLTVDLDATNGILQVA